MLAEDELTPALFAGFHRHQEVTRRRRKVDGVWIEEDVRFVEADWDADDLAEWTLLLRQTLSSGGALFGAFENGVLKGFSAVEGRLFGSKRDYLDLSQLYVSEEARGRGVGRALFCLSADWARAHGAKKLYLSAHSAVASQAFYAAMGCVEAAEYDPAHTQNEPFDCQMEYALTGRAPD